MAPPPASECSASAPPLPVALVPVLLPPSTPTWTIGHSASPGSLGTSAPLGLVIAPLLPWTCGPFVALRPSPSSALASPALPQAPPSHMVAPAQLLTSGSLLPPQGVVAAAQPRSHRSLCLTASSLLWLRGVLQLHHCRHHRQSPWWRWDSSLHGYCLLHHGRQSWLWSNY